MVYTIDYIQSKLMSDLDTERYEHSVGTAETAKLLASKYGEDEEKAFFTGLIHDCAKCLDKEKMIEILKQLPLEEGEFENSKTHHAPVGAYIAKKEFGVTDDEILSAIRWHTLGKPNMTTFEKIIFIADKIELKTRPKEWTQDIWKSLEEENGLDKALLICYKNTIKSLVDRNLKICKATIDIYNELLR